MRAPRVLPVCENPFSMVAAAFPAPVDRRAMITPAVDALCIGGLSLVACVALLLFAPVPFDRHVPALVPYLLTAGVTWPHFLASYRLLYATRESIATYRLASVYFPLALFACAAFALARASVTPVWIDLFSLVAAVYLARHYAGQTWGMIASFSHIRGVPFLARERSVMQTSLNVIMAWHIVWATAQGIGSVVPSAAPFVKVVDAHVDPLAAVSFVLGLAAFGMVAKRTGKAPSVRIVLPWLALYGWYALLRKDPTSLVVVQSSHALQYLVFPLRIEETRRRTAASPVTLRSAAIWLVALVVLGFGAFAGLPALFRLSYIGAGGVGDLSAGFLSVFVSFVNIHHYFIDSCLYKLRNPEVRRDLFAHLAPVR